MDYFNYIESIDSNEAPDYEHLIALFSRQLTDAEVNNHNLGMYDLDDEPDKIELEAQLMGKVIDGRFEIKNYLRNEFAVFVHSGLDFFFVNFSFRFTVEKLALKALFL